ncbi:MAG: phosphoribosylaminoimidazolesuccinocarboxamide synthase [Spirochaetales bacterium]|nr:phosphoribosylaminoimidazolesuccinocarboxamide synthase [Spirochaetales bacterium]
MDITEIIKSNINNTIKETDYKIGSKYKGKVRDVYDLGDKLFIVTTDRVSAFDVVLDTVPFKGAMLNGLSNYWFEQTKDIIPNHIISIPHPNAILVKKCTILPIEVIVRGYLTGGGWREYEADGTVSGIQLPKGLKKNCKFETPILTPSTKAKEGHDMPISVEEIIKQGIVEEKLMRKIADTALKLFARGQELVAKNGLILVDTKYEFGILDDGTLIVADEIHTSDSSRYWYADGYEAAFKAGEEQKGLDKEYLRRWLLDQGFKGDGKPPVIPAEVKAAWAERYGLAYKMITGKEFDWAQTDVMATLDAAVKNLTK